jgi:hypothetical protein
MAKGSDLARSVLTVSTADSSTFAGVKSPFSGRGPSAFYGYVMSFSVAGFVLVGGTERKRILRMMVIGVLMGSVLLLASCGLNGKAASSATPSQVAPGVYHLTVTATSQQGQTSMVTTITIR